MRAREVYLAQCVVLLQLVDEAASDRLVMDSGLTPH